ncbi:MAG: hypothetical protein IJM30_09570 [Thermoguttaceae bacterium]|nr:hypothetical protein [Thermoguttaceae bacterium]
MSKRRRKSREIRSEYLDRATAARDYEIKKTLRTLSLTEARNQRLELRRDDAAADSAPKPLPVVPEDLAAAAEKFYSENRKEPISAKEFYKIDISRGLAKVILFGFLGCVFGINCLGLFMPLHGGYITAGHLEIAGAIGFAFGVFYAISNDRLW